MVLLVFSTHRAQTNKDTSQVEPIHIFATVKHRKEKNTHTSIPDHCRERSLVIIPFFTSKKKNDSPHQARLKNTSEKHTQRRKKHISHSENDGSSCRRDLWVMLDNNAGGGEKTNSLTQGGGGGGGGGGAVSDVSRPITWFPQCCCRRCCEACFPK